MNGLRTWAPPVAFAAVETGLYLSYRSHDARFHWATHFLVGAAFASALMALYAWRRRRPAPLPLLWILAGHIYAMFPDFLFEAGTPHEWWMDVFLLHVRSHFVPGRNVFWLIVFLAVLGAYLVVLDRRARRPSPPLTHGRPRRRGPAGRPTASPTVGAAVAVLVVAAATLTRCDDGRRGGDVSAVASVAHVHGLGVDPGDGTLYAATHFGLFRIDGADDATRVGDRHHDLMGFTVVGPGTFLASGHPDMEDSALRRPGTPPLLGLVESRDGGVSWQPLSLLGEADFHSLVASGDHVYGFDSTGGRFMVSSDGRSWDTRSRVPLAAFAVDPADGDHLVAMTEQGLARSRDGGRSFDPIAGPPLVVLSWSAGQGLWGVAPSGDAFTLSASGWERRQPIGGAPQALLAADDAVYAAAEVGGTTTIVTSRDGGKTWTLRYRDRGPGREGAARRGGSSVR